MLDGKEVYRKDVGGKPVCGKVALEAGKRYPITITYFKGGSAAFWLEQVDLVGKGDLVTVTKKDKKFQYLLDDAGKWTVRNDVYYYDARHRFQRQPPQPPPRTMETRSDRKWASAMSWAPSTTSRCC